MLRYLRLPCFVACVSFDGFGKTYPRVSRERSMVGSASVVHYSQAVWVLWEGMTLLSGNGATSCSEFGGTSFCPGQVPAVQYPGVSPQSGAFELDLCAGDIGPAIFRPPSVNGRSCYTDSGSPTTSSQSSCSVALLSQGGGPAWEAPPCH